jgi:hypothetical protein
MAQLETELQISPREENAQDRIIVASWTHGKQDDLHLVTEALTGNGNAYLMMNGTESPADIIDQAVHLEVKAIACLVLSAADRGPVYKLVTRLRRRRLNIPVILMGEAVDPQFAQVLALPDNGDLYRGGIYYCEDPSEMLQVLKQIILFTPPPSTHEHEHTTDDSCSTCSACGDNCPFN